MGLRALFRRTGGSGLEITDLDFAMAALVLRLETARRERGFPDPESVPVAQLQQLRVAFAQQLLSDAAVAWPAGALQRQLVATTDGAATPSLRLTPEARAVLAP